MEKSKAFLKGLQQGDLSKNTIKHGSGSIIIRVCFATCDIYCTKSNIWEFHKWNVIKRSVSFNQSLFFLAKIKLLKWLWSHIFTKYVFQAIRKATNLKVVQIFWEEDWQKSRQIYGKSLLMVKTGLTSLQHAKGFVVGFVQILVVAIPGVWVRIHQ